MEWRSALAPTRASALPASRSRAAALRAASGRLPSALRERGCGGRRGGGRLCCRGAGWPLSLPDSGPHACTVALASTTSSATISATSSATGAASHVLVRRSFRRRGSFRDRLLGSRGCCGEFGERRKLGRCGERHGGPMGIRALGILALGLLRNQRPARLADPPGGRSGRERHRGAVPEGRPWPTRNALCRLARPEFTADHHDRQGRPDRQVLPRVATEIGRAIVQYVFEMRGPPAVAVEWTHSYGGLESRGGGERSSWPRNADERVLILLKRCPQEGANPQPLTQDADGTFTCLRTVMVPRCGWLSRRPVSDGSSVAGLVRGRSPLSLWPWRPGMPCRLEMRDRGNPA